jgi:TPR repeat protein
MKLLRVISLLAFWFSYSIPIAVSQTNSPTQAASTSSSPQPKWTEVDRKAFLAKAQRGDRGSQMWLGAAYEQGWFGKPNYGEALKWFSKAAAQGDPDAQNSLGQMYQDGEGVQQNNSEAAKWYRMAAEHVPDFGGAGQGRNNLGLLYLNGDGVPKDLVQAYMWFRLTGPQTNLPYAKAQMTSQQIAQAEHMVAGWKRSHSQR